jgi:transposase
MVMLAEIVDVVIGIDTHKDTHTAAVIATATGGVLATLTFMTNTEGYGQVLELAGMHGRTRAWAIEGTRTYGTGLVRHLESLDEFVIEVDRPGRPPRRGGVKTDQIDAVRCGREALANEIHAQPRTGPQRDALALLLAVRGSAVEASKIAKTQLQSFIVAAPEHLRDRLRDHTTTFQRLRACSQLRHRRDENTLSATTIDVLVKIARRIQALEAEAETHQKAIVAIIKTWRADLLDLVGVGPIVAATVLCAWSHPGRFRSEGAFAMLAGTAPIPASSGMTVRHRLNRRGDRQLNQAIHVIVNTRLQRDDKTKAYAARCEARGKTKKDTKRCLKRYVTRQLFRILENPPTTT